MLLGLLGALGAAVLYGGGTTLQAVGVRRPGARSAYAAGLLLDALGFAASLVALRTLPLFVVESAIASSVAVTAGLAVLFLGAQLSRREVYALVGVGAGLVALAASARDGHAVALSGVGSWLVLAAVLPVLVLGLVALRWEGRHGAALLAVVAGLGFGGAGVAARVVSVPHEVWRVVLHPLPWALAAYALISLVAYGLALQRGSVTTTAAVAFTVETVVPSAIGLLWLGDRVRADLWWVTVLGFVLTLGGCLLLARHSAEEAHSS